MPTRSSPPSNRLHVLSIELHGALATRLASLGTRRGSRVRAPVLVLPGETVRALMERLVRADARYRLLYDLESSRLPEHVEAVLNDRVLDLQGGLDARLAPGDVLAFLPAHAGG